MDEGRRNQTKFWQCRFSAERRFSKSFKKLLETFQGWAHHTWSRVAYKRSRPVSRWTRWLRSWTLWRVSRLPALSQQTRGTLQRYKQAHGGRQRQRRPRWRPLQIVGGKVGYPARPCHSTIKSYCLVKIIRFFIIKGSFLFSIGFLYEMSEFGQNFGWRIQNF